MTLRLVKATRCVATSQRSGERCKRWAILGGRVCPKHGGGAPQVKAAAAARVTLAEAMASEDRRSPVEILADTLHAADVLLRKALKAADQAVITPQELATIVEHLERAEQFARAVIGLGIEERRTQLAEAQGQLMFDVFTRVLGALGLSEDQAARAPALLAEEVRALTSGSNKQVRGQATTP